MVRVYKPGVAYHVAPVYHGCAHAAYAVGHVADIGYFVILYQHVRVFVNGIVRVAAYNGL